jgi:hypothetical protein
MVDILRQRIGFVDKKMSLKANKIKGSKEGYQWPVRCRTDSS